MWLGVQFKNWHVACVTVVYIGFIQTDSELRYVVDSGVPFQVSFYCQVLMLYIMSMVKSVLPMANFDS